MTTNLPSEFRISYYEGERVFFTFAFHAGHALEKFQIEMEYDELPPIDYIDQATEDGWKTITIPKRAINFKN